MEKEKKGMRQLVFGMAAYTSASILGPLVIFVAIGHVADKMLDTRVLYKIVGLAIAFVFTNILLFRQVQGLNATMEQYGLEKMEEKRKKKEQMQKEKIVQK